MILYQNKGGSLRQLVKSMLSVSWLIKASPLRLDTVSILAGPWRHTPMIGLKCLSVRQLSWTNDSLCCLLELHDNSILLVGKAMEKQEVEEGVRRDRWRGGGGGGEKNREGENGDLVLVSAVAVLVLFESEWNWPGQLIFTWGRLTELEENNKGAEVGFFLRSCCLRCHV